MSTSTQSIARSVPVTAKPAHPRRDGTGQLYTLTLRAKPDTTPVEVHLKQLLKLAVRGFGFQCVEVAEIQVCSNSEFPTRQGNLTVSIDTTENVVIATRNVGASEEATLSQCETTEQVIEAKRHLIEHQQDTCLPAKEFIRQSISRAKTEADRVRPADPHCSKSERDCDFEQISTPGGA